MSVWVEIIVNRECGFNYRVTLHVSVWVEIDLANQYNRDVIGSRSTWACELKWQGAERNEQEEPVTLHVSVWVEIRFSRYQGIFQPRHAPRERVSWNRSRNSPGLRDKVTLHVSVWVEILALFALFRNAVGHAPRERVSWNFSFSALIFSHNCHAPRERVSWNAQNQDKNLCKNVTLHVSVWVEIYVLSEKSDWNKSRSTWACELKLMVDMSKGYVWCHAPRERVSWNSHVWNSFKDSICHAPRERVSWNLYIEKNHGNSVGHAPRERVSWNDVVYLAFKSVRVTLHVSVWVEINFRQRKMIVWASRSTWACELKFHIQEFLICNIGHAPRERVSWNLPTPPFLLYATSHAPRERVSWNVSLSLARTTLIASRSTWACELKSHGWACFDCADKVTLHVSVWVEMEACEVFPKTFLSRSTWACELKLSFCSLYAPIHKSRSTWACELK